MRKRDWELSIGILFLMGGLIGLSPVAYPDGQRRVSELRPGSGRVFLYTANKLGVPILKASIKIENGFSEQGKSLYEVHASVDSLEYYGWLFRMNNRFVSTMEAETCSPIRYVKIIDQEGLFGERKNYHQTLLFDYPNKRIVAEKAEKKERQEFSLLSWNFDPLSMFAKYYLKEEIHPGQNISMSVFDGVKLRKMVFYSKKEKVNSKIYGEVESVCIESSTSFSTFEDKEGKIRICYVADGEKTPILIELELPIGNIKFELESIGGS